MSDTKDLLERASRSAPSGTFDLPDLERRRDRRHTRRRIGTAIVALALAAVTFGSAFVALREDRETAIGTTGATGGTGAVATTDGLTPATVPPLEAGPGEYYFTRIHLVGECTGSEEACGSGSTGWTVRLAATFWWSPDDSGRIEVTDVEGYGIEPGSFEPGSFPNYNGIDVSGFPTDAAELAEFLLARSQPDGASPAPLVTPPPEGAPQDGRMWRAITDLLHDPHVTPAVRAALLDVAAGLRGSHVELGVTDPVGRPADVVEFGNVGGELIERLFVDPTSHELLAMTTTLPGAPGPIETWLVEMAGVAPSTDEGPTVTSIPTVG